MKLISVITLSLIGLAVAVPGIEKVGIPGMQKTPPLEVILTGFSLAL